MMVYPTRVKLKNNKKREKVKYLLVLLNKAILLILQKPTAVFVSAQAGNTEHKSQICLLALYQFELNQNILSCLLNASFCCTILWDQVIWELQSTTRWWLYVGWNLWSLSSCHMFHHLEVSKLHCSIICLLGSIFRSFHFLVWCNSSCFH